MNFKFIRLGESLHFLVIENLMTSQELSEIWEEVNLLSYRSKLLLDTSTARNADNSLKANKQGFFLDDVYRYRKFSNYFNYYKKWISLENKKKIEENNMSWRPLFNCKHDKTLFSYYEDSDFYDEHQDTALYTQLFWIFKEPKKFEGGQLELTDFNYQIEVNNNTMVIFPSWYSHKVNKVTLQDKTPEQRDKLLCNGRYVFTTFYNLY